jgi:hypothetical protein
MRVLLLAFVVGLAGASAAIAAPAGTGSGEIRMQALLDDNGFGRLLVNNTDGPWRWQSCTPDLSDCQPLSGGREISTVGVRSPAVFRVESEGLTGTSPEWRGRVKQLAPPSVSGVIRANEFVSPVPGRWALGWEGEFSELQLSACHTASGNDCTTLTDSHYVRRECSSRDASQSGSFVIEARFAGRYLRVANRRIGVGPPLRLAYAVTSPYGGDAWPRDRITSVATVGLIAAPTRDFPGECGPPVPSEGSISKHGLGFVRCSERCRATLTAGRAGRVVRVKREVAQSRSGLDVGLPERVVLPASKMARLGEGSIRVALRVDGKLLAKRNVHLGD